MLCACYKETVTNSLMIYDTDFFQEPYIPR